MATTTVKDGGAANKKTKQHAVARTRQFVDAIVNLALDDADNSVPERHPSTTGERLLERAQTRKIRHISRHGDKYEARRIYTAVRFLYATEINVPHF